MRKRMLSILLSMSMISSLIPVMNVNAAGTVTRAEWISQLVDTFGMTVESDDNMPDNYFSDIEDGADYYRDVLLAVEFGVIDIEAGEEFLPDETVTREFAAQTLNACLDFQLNEDEDYTYSEYDSVTYPDDIQVAINRGWFTLSSGNALPDKAITTEESAAMLEDASVILAEEGIDENYDSQYTFAEGVVVVPKTSEVTIAEDNTVTIADTETEINADDIFVVYSGDIPVALKALSVDTENNVTTISATDEGTEGAVISADSEGSMEIDIEDFTFDEQTTYTITDTATQENEDLMVELQSVDYDEGSKTLTASQKISLGSATAGTVTVKLKNLRLEHKEKVASDIYEAVIVADTNVTTAISFDFGNYAGLPSSIMLGYVNIAGVGSVSLSMEYSIQGGVSMSWDGEIRAGFSYNQGDFRLVKNYTKKGFTFTAEAQVTAGMRISAEVRLGLVSGSVYGTIGVKMSFNLKNYNSGTPKTCVTIKGYMYAYIGANISIVGKSVMSGREDIFTESNSPVRVVYHYEDNILVGSCNRGDSLKYTTSVHSNYFNTAPSYGSSSYGGNGSGSSGTTAEPVVIWEYSLDDNNNATITKYRGNASAIAIPSKIDGYMVTAIGYSAFDGNTNIRSVTMPDSVTEIEHNAFSGCTNLSSVNLSKSLETLGYYAFRNCESLTEIEIPKSLTRVTTDTVYYSRYGAFNNSGLKKVTFEEGTTKIPAYLFYGANKLEDVKLLDTITEIGGYAFNECTSLSNIDIPSSVVTIGNSAFSGCTNLSSVNLSKSLETLGYYAFRNCESLTEIEIPKSLTRVTTDTVYYSRYGAFNNSGLKKVTFEEGTTKIPSYLFYDANKLTDVELLDTITVIGYAAFCDCTSLAMIDIPDSVVTIESGAFENCTSLSNIDIPDSVTEIGSSAFSGCTNLSSVNLSKSLETLGYYAFRNCESLTEIEIPKSLTTTIYVPSGCYGAFNNSGLTKVTFEQGRTRIPPSLFYGANKLTDVELIDSITEIGWSAFEVCTSLLNIDIPNSVVTIEDSALAGCTSLSNIDIPDSVIEIGKYAFQNCTNLSSVSLSNNIKEINDDMFYNCTSLTDIQLPDSVKIIGESAFQNCTSLENINLHNNITEIGSSAFQDCSSLKDITIPSSVKFVGLSAFKNCDSLTSVTANINGSIGSSAFYDCDALTTLTLGDGVSSIGSSLCYGCDNLSNVTFGKHITEIPDSAFRLCPKLETVTLPRFCKTIRANAFAENTGLKSAYVPPTVTSIETNSFSYPAKMTMYGQAGSYAHEYSFDREMAFSIVNAPITSMNYADSDMTMNRGETVYPKLNIEPAFDTDVVTFSSSDEDVLTVSEIGGIYARNYGTATITATSGSGKSTSIDITVLKTASSVKLSSTKLLLEKGKTEQLTATISPSDAIDTLSWSSSNPNIASVDNEGNVTAVSAGTATITVTASHSKVSASCTVNVYRTDVAVTGISLNKDSADVVIGENYTLTATILPSNATNKNVTWTSSDETVASVNNGVVTALGEGTTTVTVTTEDGGYTASCDITVIQKPEITSLTNDGNAVTVTAVNVPESAVVYIAAYDNNCLVGLETVTLADNTAQVVFENENIDSFKAFIWYDEVRPLTDSKESELI